MTKEKAFHDGTLSYLLATLAGIVDEFQEDLRYFDLTEYKVDTLIELT